MDNYDIIGSLYNEYKSELDKRDNNDYEVNVPQMDKFAEIYRFLIEEMDESGGEMMSVDLVPREEHGGITCELPLLYLYGEKIEKFAKFMTYMSAITFDAKLDGSTCISLVVPNVFKHK